MKSNNFTYQTKFENAKKMEFFLYGCGSCVMFEPKKKNIVCDCMSVCVSVCDDSLRLSVETTFCHACDPEEHWSKTNNNEKKLSLFPFIV